VDRDDSRRRQGRWIKSVAILLAAASSVHLALAHGIKRVASVKAPAVLQAAVQCLVAADFVRLYGLPYVGLKVNAWAWAQYKIGPLGEWDAGSDMVEVVLYAANGTRGMLLLAEPNARGGYLAIENGYHLKRHGTVWNADYGNGGFVDYEQIGKAVTILSRQPRYRVHLVQGGSQCTQDKD
jgi:hypothetical protein